MATLPARRKHRRKIYSRFLLGFCEAIAAQVRYSARSTLRANLVTASLPSLCRPRNGERCRPNCSNSPWCGGMRYPTHPFDVT